MVTQIKNKLLSVGRSLFLTSNTIRYRIEYRSILVCLEHLTKPIGSLLDAGAGSGEMSRKLLAARHCRHLTAIEPCSTNFAKLQENFRHVKNTTVVQAGLESIPLPDSSMDAVMSTQVFEHILDHEQAAREVVRVMKPGGSLIISVPHPPELYPNPGHVRPGYTEEDLRMLFEPLGMTFVHAEYSFTLPTLRRVMAAQAMPLNGRFLPVRWGDCEAHLSNDERRAQQPFVITSLFTKSS